MRRLPEPTVLQQSLYDRMLAALTTAAHLGAELRATFTPEQRADCEECTLSLFEDLRPHEVLDEMGDAYHADQLFDFVFNSEYAEDYATDADADEEAPDA